MIPQVLVDPTQPGVMYVVTVQDPDAGTKNPPSSEVVIATLTQNASGTWSTTTSTIARPVVELGLPALPHRVDRRRTATSW